MDRESFDHIERRIREAAENVSPEFSENSWEKMNGLLDKEFPVKKRRRKGLLLIGSMAVLAVAGGVFFTTSRISTNDPDIMINGLAPEQKPGRKEDISLLDGRERIPAPEQKSGRNGLASPGSQPGMAETGNMLPATGTQDVRGGQETVRGHAAVLMDRPALVSITNVQKKKSGAEREKRMLNHSVPPLIRWREGETGGKQDGGLSYVKSPRLGPLFPITKNAGLPGQSGDTAQVVKTVKINKPLSVRGFYLTGMAGLSSNSATALISGRLSGQYGLGVGYRFSRRLSAQLVLLAGNKRYEAQGRDYKFEPGSYFTTVNMLEIDADCYVYEVPFSVRYDWLPRSPYSLYATAGFSSYFMSREDYLYNYEKSGSYHTAGRSYKGNRHFFSAAGISVGYERKITPVISVTAEPYIKIPLTGIGEGSIRLRSAGLLFGIRYDLPK